jgi:hypothetical protein
MTPYRFVNTYEHHWEMDCFYKLSYNIFHPEDRQKNYTEIFACPYAWNLTSITCFLQPTVFTNRDLWEFFLSHSTLRTYATEVVSLNNRLIICFAAELTAGCDNDVKRDLDVKSARRDTKCYCTFKTNDHKTTFFFSEWPFPSLWRRLLAH